jgi:hypothetical protein
LVDGVVELRKGVADLAAADEQLERSVSGVVGRRLASGDTSTGNP